MEKLADIGMFESLQNGANSSFHFGPQINIVNIEDPDDYYTGKPKNLEVLVSEPATGKKIEPGNCYYRYVIFKTTDGNFALQETWPDETGKISMTGLKNRVVASGSLDSIVQKHNELTGEAPKFKPGFDPEEQ